DSSVFSCILTQMNLIKYTLSLHDALPIFTVTAYPSFLPQSYFKHLAEGNCYVFNGVMNVYMSVTSGLDRQVHQRVTSQRIKHMVVKRHTRRNIAATSAINVELNVHIGFRSGSLHRCFSARDQFSCHRG